MMYLIVGIRRDELRSTDVVAGYFFSRADALNGLRSQILSLFAEDIESLF